MKKRKEITGMFGKKKKYHIPVNDYEYMLILESLFAFRNKLLEQGKFTDGIDEVIIKVCT